MDSYQVLSGYYDRFTDDVGYTAWADYFEMIFEREHIAPKTLLDLACGTGTLTELMARRGYQVTGVDASEDMLTKACMRTMELAPRPMLIHQRMETLALCMEFDVCLCCLDSVNYVVQPQALAETFCRVFAHLAPGGLFIFDVNTPKKFEDIAGQSFVREDGDVYCVWQCLLDGTVCNYEFDIFENKGKNCWKRYQETHRERVYQVSELREMLADAGFTRVAVYPELSFDRVSGGEQRLFFTARKEDE